jgi:hypothetical protein
VPAKKQEREGLPPGYRMRADAHYVEHLTSRRGEKGASEAARALSELPDRQETRDRTEKLFTQLSEDIATIESAIAALAGDASRMARRVNVDLIKSQAWRAGWALRARAILEGRHRAQMRPRPLAFLLGHVRSGWAAECRLSGITLDVHASDWNAVVAVDEQSLIAGLNGALVSTLGVIGQADGATVTVAATAAGGELKAIDVVQDEVLVAPSDGGRFFDPSWTDRPGGWFAGFGAATARAVAHQHGGEAVFLAGEHHGSTVRLQFGRS